MMFNKTGTYDLGNNSMHSSVPEENFFKNEPISVGEWFNIVAFLLILSTGVVGNGLVIYVFGFKKKIRHRSTTEWLILYLGIIDLLASIFNPTLYIYWTSTHYTQWHFGYVGCKILPAIGPITTSASAGVLIIFALDRYMAIVSPFNGHITWKAITVAFIINVGLCILFFVHYIYSIVYHPDGQGSCYVPNTEVLEYSIPNCVFIILRLSIFIVVFTITNVRIFKVLKKRKSTSTLKELRIAKHNQNKRIIKVLMIMGIAFIILVFPRELFYLAFQLSWFFSKDGIPYNKKILAINSWMKVMHTANSCANVFIYSHMQTLYRKQLLKMFYYLTCRKEMLTQFLFNNSMSRTVTLPLISRKSNSMKGSQKGTPPCSIPTTPQPSPIPNRFTVPTPQITRTIRFELTPDNKYSFVPEENTKTMFFTRAEAWKDKSIKPIYL